MTAWDEWKWLRVLAKNPEAKAQAERWRRRQRGLRTPAYLRPLLRQRGIEPYEETTK